MIYTFNTVVNPEQTAQIICSTIKAIGGTIIKNQGNIIDAKWRSPKFHTVLPTKFSFVIGQDAVRVMCGNGMMEFIVVDLGQGKGAASIWMTFVEKLLILYPDLNFGLRSGEIVLDKIKFLTDGIEQTVRATSVTNDHLFIPDVTYTIAKTQSHFSKTVLVTARYSNGLLAEGHITKGSRDYNIIMANITQYTN